MAVTEADHNGALLLELARRTTDAQRDITQGGNQQEQDERGENYNKDENNENIDDYHDKENNRNVSMNNNDNLKKPSADIRPSVGFLR